MKIWVDDIHTPPSEGWDWCMDSQSAIDCLCQAMWEADNIDNAEPVELMSLDHDLGGDDTTRPIVLWMCENDFWPVEVRVHTQNPVGHFWLISMIDRYKT